MNKPELENQPSTLNEGDKVSNEPQTIEEKEQQVAVDTVDMTGAKLTVPTYFVVEDEESGEKEALHHIQDAEEISDTIRQARVDESGERKWW